MHYLRVEGKPLSKAENEDLDEVPQGLAAKKEPLAAKGPIAHTRTPSLSSPVSVVDLTISESSQQREST